VANVLIVNKGSLEMPDDAAAGQRAITAIPT
jgi:hypothetical protein